MNNEAHWVSFHNVLTLQSDNLVGKVIFDSTLQFRTNFLSEFILFVKINQNNIFGNTSLQILSVYRQKENNLLCYNWRDVFHTICDVSYSLRVLFVTLLL